MRVLLRLMTALVGALPWGALGPLGAAIGWIAGSVLRIRRQHVEASMRAAGVERAPRVARAMYRSLGASAVELLWLASGRGDATGHVAIDPASAELWRAAKARGRGVVIAASHTGNWDLAACAMARETELLVVTKRLSVRSLDRFWQGARAAQGISLADARGALTRARAVLGRGGAVAMMIDQAPASPRHAAAVEFLGRPALADRAPATFAAARGAPLVVAASRRDAAGGHVLHVLAVLVPPARPTHVWIEEATVAAARALDRFVRAHPSQWLWLHRRWKGVPVDGASGESMLAPSWQETRSSSQVVASRAD